MVHCLFCIPTPSFLSPCQIFCLLYLYLAVSAHHPVKHSNSRSSYSPTLLNTASFSWWSNTLSNTTSVSCFLFPVSSFLFPVSFFLFPDFQLSDSRFHFPVSCFLLPVFRFQFLFDLLLTFSISVFNKANFFRYTSRPAWLVPPAKTTTNMVNHFITSISSSLYSLLLTMIF